MSDVESVEGQEAESVEVEVTETQDQLEDAVEENPEEVEEPQESVEERLERLERENKGLQKAVNRKTAAARQVNEVLQRERQEKAELLSKLKQESAESPEPTIDDFDTHDEYVNALADYRAKQKINQERQEQVKREQFESQQKQVQERMKMRQEQEAVYRVDNPHYNESVNEVQSFIDTLEASNNLNQATAQAFIDQLYREENVPAVIDYFGKNGGENLEKLGEIAQMPPPLAAVELYKIQQSLKSITQTKKEEKTLPKPHKPVKATGSSRGLGAHSTGDDVLKAFGFK